MKGILFTVEVAFSILMILFILVFLFQGQNETPEYRTINYKYQAYHGLEVLEKRGDLRDNAVSLDVDEIETDISNFIPSHLTYEVVLYNETANITEIPVAIHSQEDVISVSYLIAGDMDAYNPKDVRVYLWGFS